MVQQQPRRIRPPIRNCSVLAFAFLHLFAGSALADELLLLDGSRIVGKVVTKEGNSLQFKTSFAGTLKVRWDQVSELKVDEPAKVLLSNDDVIQARVFRNSDESTVVESEPDAPAQTFPVSELAFINPEPWRLGKGFKFTGRINFALESERGNTDTDEIDFDGDLLWRRLHDRFTLFGELEYDRADGNKTADKNKLSGKYDYFVTKKRYYGGYLFFESDEFADLDLRAGAGPGIGYQFFESKALNLRAELGILRVHENFKTEENDNYWGSGWLINFDKFLLNEFMQVYHRQTGLWNLYNTSDVVWNTWTGLRIPLVMGLVASTELKVEYDTGAAEGADELDTTYKLKLGYQW